MNHSNSVVKNFLSNYKKEEMKYATLAEIAKHVFESKTKASTMNPAPLCTARGKTSESLCKKLAARDKDANGGNGYMSAAEIYKDVSDLAGIRILLYFPDHWHQVESILSTAFEQVHPKRESTTYRAKMYRVHVRTDDLRDLDLPSEANVVEVQVVSLLMHVWAEVEHRNYKGLINSSPQEKVVLDRLKDVTLEGENVLQELFRLYSGRHKT